jgi:hypothetical protein
MLGNAQVMQAVQWRGFYDTGRTGETKLFNASICEVIRDSMPRCETMLPVCEDSGYDMLVCAPVLQWCREHSVFFIQQIGIRMTSAESVSVVVHVTPSRVI